MSSKDPERRTSFSLTRETFEKPPRNPSVYNKEGNYSTISSSWNQSNTANKFEAVESSFQGGSVQTHHYFGDAARLKFFERYRQLKNQSLLTLTKSRQPLDRLYFEKDRPMVATTSSIASDFVSSPIAKHHHHNPSGGIHGPLLAGEESDYSVGKQSSSFFLTTGGGGGGGESLSLNEPQNSSFQPSYDVSLQDDEQINEDLDEEDSLFDHLDNSLHALGKVTFQRSQTENSLIIPNMSLIHKTTIPLKRRPQTAPNNVNGVIGLRPSTAGVRDRSRSPSAERFRSNEEKKRIRKLLPKPISASSGRKIYKFEDPSSSGINSKPSSANHSKYSHQNYEFGNQSSMISASAATVSLSRAKSANPNSKQSSRYTFVRKGSISASAKKKYPKKKKSSFVGGGGDDEGDRSEPFKGNNLEHDDGSSATATSMSSDWLLSNEHLNHSDDYTELMITSPRTKFLVNCINAGMNPRASLLLRKNITKRLELQHLGMGDKMAVSLANAIRDLPFVESINIADNMLTDVGMGPLIHAAVDIPTLTELNLSQNIIDSVSAKALHDYLMAEHCTLKILVLNHADVDDFECSGFIEAVKQNKSLRELDLSGNLIGKSENLNTVKGDIITGSEAIADLLRSAQCNLTKLQLQWNMIRLDGAIDLAQSISINHTLIYLDLSFNSLSTDAGIILGVSLLKNQRLQSLILSNNSIDAKACFTICAGIIENSSLKKVVLDGNPIGLQGMRALMLIPILVGNRVKVSAAKCNVTIKDPKCWFDFDQLVQDYRLNMEDGYERAIAIIILHLIAGHQTFSFQKFALEPKLKRPPTSSSEKEKKSAAAAASSMEGSNTMKLKNIDLTQVMIREEETQFDSRQNQIIKELKKVCESASDLKKAGSLFHEYDLNSNGCLEEDELKSLLKGIGLEISSRRLKGFIDSFDADGDGCLEIFEFILLLRSLHQESYLRLQEMKYAPFMIATSDLQAFQQSLAALEAATAAAGGIGGIGRPAILVPSTIKHYLPPEQGFLHISITDNLVHKTQYRILTSCQRENILSVVKSSGSSNLIIPMISAAVEHIKLRLDEAIYFAEIMLKESHDRLEIARNILFQIDNSKDASHFLYLLFNSNRMELSRLKREFGMLLRCILGNPTGYYCLDLTKSSHRKCLGKLSAISASEGSLRKDKYNKMGVLSGHRALGDVSQKGNYSCFRNEMLNGKPVTITSTFCSPIPTNGKLEFDFACHLKSSLGSSALGVNVMPMTDERVIRLLIRYFFLPAKDVGVALQKLFDLKVNTEIALSCNGVMSAMEDTVCSYDRMKEIAEHLDNFYNQLPIRWHLHEEALEKLSRPIVEVHGKVIELFERDPKHPIPLSITDEYRRKEEIKEQLYQGDVLLQQQIMQSTTRKLSAIAAKGLRQRRNSLVLPTNVVGIGGGGGDGGAEEDEDSSSNSDSSDRENNSLDSFSLISPRMMLNGQEESKGMNDENAIKSPIELHAASFSTISIRGMESRDFGMSGDDNVAARGINLRASWDLGTRDEDDERYDPQNQIEHIGQILDHLDELRKQKALSQKRNLTKQRRRFENQEKYFKSKSFQKIEERRRKIFERRRNACFENYNTVTITEYEKDYFSKLQSSLEATTIQPAMKAHRMIDLLEEIFAQNWIYCRHLALILECFSQYGYYKQTKYFGTFRVEAAVLLFSRIVDVHNMEFVLKVMSPYEVACFIGRIGYLNLFNPCKPEGAWELDLSRREERIIAKILISLAIVEPGENWFHQGFRWGRSNDPVPGWALTEGWLTEEGLPNRGMMWLTYYSGEGKGKKGCKPHVPFRKALTNLVLLDERDMITEENSFKPYQGILSGEAYFKSNPGLWDTFLAPHVKK